MNALAPRPARSLWHRGARRALALLPREPRFALLRRMARGELQPRADLELKIAETADELEACFAILHDAYVGSGFMQPDPSGLRVTPWHALPTTTTVCAKVGGEVVGTLSMVREGVFGLPMQTAFDLAPVRQRSGQLAEISALAVRRDHRHNGGAVLFPLMKFMYEYCSRYFDTRHLLIAVNPNKIELYESLLFFERLPEAAVENYAFANGAAAIGATLDLQAAPGRFEQAYRGRRGGHDLHHYFVHARLPQLRLPQRPYYTTNDPVMTPALLDRFFNQRTRVFEMLTPRQRQLLHSIYDSPAYRAVLPSVDDDNEAPLPLRRHQRHSIKCPGWFVLDGQGTGRARRPLNLVEISQGGCRVELGLQDLPLGGCGDLVVMLGEGVRAQVRARVVRRAGPAAWGLAVERDDAAWWACVQALEGSPTYRELAAASDTDPAPLPQALLSPG